MPSTGAINPRKINALILAESANPEWESVPLIGWSLSQALSKQVNAHVVTQIRNRDAFVRAGLVEGRDFTAIDNEYMASPLIRLSEKFRGHTAKGWTTLTALLSVAYYSFESQVWRRFETRLLAGEFDLVHRVTPLSPTTPSPIAKRLARIKIPFVVGPLNGGLPWLKSFRDRQLAEHDRLSDFRRLYKLMPGYKSTRLYASALICGSRHTYSEMPSWTSRKRVYIPENGIDLKRFSANGRSTSNNPLRGAFVGRLVPYKGVDMLLRAAAEFLKRNELELHIVGDGPEKERLEALVRQLEVAKNVFFCGWIKHVDVQNKLRNCDFTILPSIREFGGGVVIESMALGLPPIVADYGGPPELVSDSTGIRVPFSDEATLIAGLSDAISRFVHFREALHEMGTAGQKFVREKMTWEAKAMQIRSLYDAILAGEDELSEHNFF